MQLSSLSGPGVLAALFGVSCASSTPPSVVRPETSEQIVNDFSQLRPSGMGLVIGGQTVGELTIDDYLWEPDGSYMQVWELPVLRNEPVTVELSSDDFDAYLWVKGPGLDLNDDDGAGACNSRITFTPSTDGVYRVIVNTLQSGATGSFELTAAREAGPPDPSRCDLAFTMDDEEPFLEEDSAAFREMLAALPVTGELDLAASVDGRLDSGSEIVNSRYVDAWSLELSANQTATVDLLSSDFDSYLWVLGRERVRSDDDGAGACNSRITLRPATETRYTVVATSFGGNGLGDYTLAVSESPGPVGEGACPGDTFGSTIDLVANLEPQPRTLELGADITGTLSERDDITDEDRFVQIWEYTGLAGDDVAIELSSSDFDTYLWFVGHELRLSDDDAGSNCNSTIIATLPVDGTYRIGVSAFSSMATGSYRLSISSEPGPERPGSCGSDTISGGNHDGAWRRRVVFGYPRDGLG